MKLEFIKGVVTLQSEAEGEALLLMQFALNNVSLPKEVVKKEPRKHASSQKKHKKHEFVKRCEVCGKGFKGLRSLNMHRSKLHGIRSKNYEVYRKWRLARKEQAVKEEFNAVWK